MMVAMLPLKVFAGPSVVVSIAPVHSLVAGVMTGVGEPTLLMPPGQSPHTQPLSPEAIRSAHSADLLIWAGAEFEVSLAKIVSQAGNTRTRELALLDGLTLLPARSGGIWEEGDVHSHSHGKSSDPHFWLSTVNAGVMVEAVAGWLVEMDPQNSTVYIDNRDDMLERIGALRESLVLKLEPVGGLSYLVFHDAYQYFEREFDLSPAGAISVGPSRNPGAKRIRDLRRLIAEKEVRCVFTEPQFEPKLVQTIAEDSEVAIGELDPLGTGLEPGSDQWFTLMSALADNLGDCLISE